MTTAELAARMGVSQSRVSQLERAEPDGSIRLSTLERAAHALNCQLHYVLVPNEALDDMVRRQARARATAEVASITHSMRLEDQAPDPQVIMDEVDALTDSYIGARGLWRLDGQPA